MTQKALYYTQNVCSYDAQNFKKDASFVKVWLHKFRISLESKQVNIIQHQILMGCHALFGDFCEKRAKSCPKSALNAR